MDWSNQDVLLLVDLVRRRPCLYDQEYDSHHNPKMKQDVLRELSSIISSTRPGTTVQDISKKWEEVCSKYMSYCKKVMVKKKPQSKLFFFDKMEFMKPYLGLPVTNPMFNKHANARNKDAAKDQMTESNGRLSGNKERYPCLELSQVEMSPNDVTSDEENDSADVETNRGSVSAISIHSDNSPLVNITLPSQSNSSRKRRHSTISLSSQATRNQDVSCVTIGSALVNVNDSILDRTESFMNQSYGKANVSYESKDTYSQEEDEDHYYMRYILCKVKKLEGAQKLNFKIQLERLLYECMKQ